MNALHQLLPVETRLVAEKVQAGFGVSADTAALLILLVVGFASGKTQGLLLPEGRRIIPSFNLALVSSGQAMEYGAFNALVTPVNQSVAPAFGYRELHGPEATQIALEALLTQKDDLRKLITEQEARLAKLKAANARADKFGEKLRDKEKLTPADRKLLQDNPVDHLGENIAAAAVQSSCEQLERLHPEIALLQVAAAPGILVSEPRWNQLSALKARSFDQSTLAIMFSPENVASAVTVRPAVLAEVAALFRESNFGGGGLNAVVHGSDQDYTRLLGHPAVSVAGLFTTFLFVESAGGPCVISEIREVRADAGWKQLCAKLVDARMTGVCRNVQVSDVAVESYVEFRQWCMACDGHPAFLSAVRLWPDLCMRLSLALAILHEAPEINPAHVGGVAGYLQSVAPGMAAMEHTSDTGRKLDRRRHMRPGRPSPSSDPPRPCWPPPPPRP